LGTRNIKLLAWVPAEFASRVNQAGPRPKPARKALFALTFGALVIETAPSPDGLPSAGQIPFLQEFGPTAFDKQARILT